MELFGVRARRPHEWAAWAIRVIDERAGLYNAKRHQIAEAAFLEQIEKAASAAGSDRRALYALVRRGLAWAAASDDALYARLRSSSSEPSETPPDGMIDLDIAHLLADAGLQAAERG